MIDSIHSLRSSHMMGFRAYTTDTVGENGYFLHLSANTEALETAQFRDLEVGIGEITLVIEEYIDLAMTFQTSDRVD
jgi:hypothetical protein